MIDKKLYIEELKRIEAEFQEAARIAEVDRERDALAFLRAKDERDLDLIVAGLLYNTDDTDLESRMMSLKDQLGESKFSQLQTKLEGQ